MAACMGLVAAAGALHLTRSPGPGITGDSMAYLDAGASLVSRGSLEIRPVRWDDPDRLTPLAHWPPGYSFAIAVPVLAGATPVQSARWIQALAAFIMVGGATLLAGTLLGAALPAVLLGASLMVIPAVTWVHLYVLSEPLFLAGVVLLLLLWTWYPQWALLAGGTLAAMFLVRYAGLALAPASAALIFATEGTWKTRLGRAMLVFVPTATVALIWLSRSVADPGPRPIRTLGIYPGLVDELRIGLRTMVAWLAPVARPGAREALIVATTGLAIWALMRTAGMYTAGRRVDRVLRDEPLARAVLGALWLGAAYTGFVFLSRAVADPFIQAGPRMLVPALILFHLGIGLAVASAWKRAAIPTRLAVGAIAAAWLVLALRTTVSVTMAERARGLDFVHLGRTNEDLLTWVRGQEPRPLFSNSPWVLALYADREARYWPMAEDTARVPEFARSLRERSGLVVEFTEARWTGVVPPAVLTQRARLCRVAEFGNAAVWEPCS